MRDPNSPAFQKWNRLAATGQMIGRDRPVTRITLSKQRLKSLASNRPGPWRYELFQGGANEFAFVKDVQINRSLGDDAATCTITCYNDYMQWYASSPQGIDTGIGRPGYLTYNRGDVSPIKTKSIYNQFVDPENADNVTQFQGFEYTYPENDPSGETLDPVLAAAIRAGAEKTLFPTEWGYPYAGAGDAPPGTPGFKYYYERLIPNRLLRTYQGFGSDNLDENGQFLSVHEPGYVKVEDDSQLVITGNWLIDRVTFSSDGMITISCRDIAKVLLEQIVYPPMIPLNRFPLVYCPETPPSGEKGSVSQNLARGYDASSNDPWYGRNAKVFGHRPSDGFDGHSGTYWLSVGNQAANDGYSFEFLQTSVNNQTVNEILLSTKGTGYVLFVSVMENGVWQGTETVPYDPNNPASFPNGSNIKYVMKTTVGTEAQQTIRLPRAYKAQKVRVTFTNLWDSGLGTFQRRAAVREFKVRYTKPDTFKAGTIGQPGFISDWSSAIKELCGWAGFTWRTDTNVTTGVSEPSGLPADPLIGTGINGEPLRIWGDFEVLGAGPIECTPSDFFLNKSFKEAINTIRDFLGCIFMIDESGGAIFRFPNVFTGGNFITDPDSPDASAYLAKEWPIEFHENANLITYEVTIDDSQVRSEIVVVGTNPDTTSSAPLAAGVVLGTNAVNGETSAVNFTNVLAGQYRLFLVPGSQTAGFKTVEECQRMAELIGLRILQSYRKGSAQILGHPGLQLDDQVRIFERVTNEYNVHYVSGISSRMDMESGEYVMDVTTHWLGDDPSRDWFLDRVALTPAVKNIPAILKRIGQAANTPPGPGGQGSDPSAQAPRPK